jgi:hypothetical protein
VPGTHRALQIDLLGFFKAYTSDMIGSRIVTCQLLATVIKCLQLRSPKTRSSALFWAYTSTKVPARTELRQLYWNGWLRLSKLTSVDFSLSAGVFPAIWKESFVIPLFKSGDKCDVSCYRGISILSAIPKLFEKMVCNRITPVVLPVISDAQHGFVKGRSQGFW